MNKQKIGKERNKDILLEKITFEVFKNNRDCKDYKIRFKEVFDRCFSKEKLIEIIENKEIMDYLKDRHPDTIIKELNNPLVLLIIKK